MTEKSKHKWKDGIERIQFLVKLYKKQVDQGRVLLHEQPAHAKSWMIPEIRKMMAEAGFTVVEADQCMYGLRTVGPDRRTEMHAKKPTKSMPNSRALGKELSNKCDGKHAHQSLVDGRALKASRYPQDYVRRYVGVSSRSNGKGMKSSARSPTLRQSADDEYSIPKNSVNDLRQTFRCTASTN